MEILIGADVAPTDINEALFNNGDIKKLLGSELKELWESADFRVFNLETPITDFPKPIKKQGPNLLAASTTVKGIKALNPSLISLANNHILDHGTSGLNDTINLLKNNGVLYIGVGHNQNEASKPHIFIKNGVKVGFYTCAESEFSIVTAKSSGANPFDPLETLDHISNLKKECDHVVVIYHGGKEHYRYPSPNLQKTCRKMAEKGADLIICQHSHCIGSFEKYKSSNIIYGQGNFLFNKYDNEYWNTSLLVKVSFADKMDIDFIPIVKTNFGTRLASNNESKQIIHDFMNRSSNIANELFIVKEYEEFSKRAINNYFRTFSGIGKWTRRFDKYILKNRIINNKYRENQLLAMQNFIECEAHRELLLTGLKGKNERY